MRPLYILFGGVLLVILLTGLLSCRTVKATERLEVRYDSTAIRRVETLERTLRQVEQERDALKLDSSGVRIEFDTLTVSEVVIDSSGVVRATGALRSVQVSNTRLQRENERLKQRLDSIRSIVVHDTVTVAGSVVYTERTVKRTLIPWWVWVVIAGLVILNFRHQLFKIWTQVKNGGRSRA